MVRINRLSIYIVVTLVPFFSKADFLVTAQQVNGGLTISKPGVWILQEDVTLTNGSSVTINTSDVTFDMNGHTIDGANVNSAGIQCHTADNIAVINGTLKNFGQDGLIAESVTGLIVQKVVVINPSNRGIVIQNSQNVVIDTSAVIASGSTGISVLNSTIVDITHCYVNNSRASGIAADENSSQFGISGTIVAGSVAIGYQINAAGSILYGSYAVKNNVGCSISAQDCQITGCNVNTNTLQGILVNNNNTLLDSSLVQANGGDGIQIAQSVVGCVIKDCTITDNRGYGIRAQSTLSATLAGIDTVKNNAKGDFFRVQSR